MGYKTPNIDSIANEGMMFTDYYAEQSCTAGRAAFIIGQNVYRTSLSKVGMPGAEIGMHKKMIPSSLKCFKVKVMCLGNLVKTILATKFTCHLLTTALMNFTVIYIT
jgi:arylsulfatase